MLYINVIWCRYICMIYIYLFILKCYIINLNVEWIDRWYVIDLYDWIIYKEILVVYINNLVE